jgi:hypothetical protein
VYIYLHAKLLNTNLDLTNKFSFVIVQNIHLKSKKNFYIKIYLKSIQISWDYQALNSIQKGSILNTLTPKWDIPFWYLAKFAEGW